MNQRIPIPRTAREREARFYIELGMMIEPRMWFTQEGPARAIEAVDDLGQSLVRRETTRVEADHSLFYNGGGVTQGQVQLDLAMPDKPGRSIVRLRGSIPVAIQVRRPVPALEIPLSAPKGKTFAHEDAVFTLREVREDDQGTRIERRRPHQPRSVRAARRSRRRDRLVPAPVPGGPPGRDRRCRWPRAGRVRRGRLRARTGTPG